MWARTGHRLAYLMLPKPRGLADVVLACDEIDRLSRINGLQRVDGNVPVHVLIETHGALREVDAIAGHHWVQSLSFRLMDFVSALRGAIPFSGMSAQGQFRHPFVLRAKLEIAAACQGHGKTPSRSVVTEFGDSAAIQEAATLACFELGYTRM